MFGILFWIFVFLIFYTYAGYPLIVELLARFKKKVPEYFPIQPSVSLMIAAFNEEHIIEAKINNALNLDYPREKLQIIVANDNSTDQTAAIANKYAGQGVLLVTTPDRMGKIGNINHAAQFAEGEILVISDATNMYDRNAIQELVNPFSDPSVGISGGIHVIEQGDGVLGDSEGFYWKYETWIENNESILGTCITANGDILAIRRELWKEIPVEVINDDLYLAITTIRDGKRVVITPKAIGRERVSPSARDEIIRRTRMNAGLFQAMSMSGQTMPWRYPQYVWQIISHKFMRPLLPFWMIGALLANLGAILWPSTPGKFDFFTLAYPYQWIFAGLQFFAYLLAWVGNLSEKTKNTGFLIYLPTFLVNSNLAALKGFMRYLNRQQTNQWQRVERRNAITDSQ
jgi:cellulose synthase/poly-beta-1,6-N-acetylglucosamine synthase-like glycosyltransferase